MDNDKKSLIVIIILLVIVLPGAVLGTVRHSQNSKKSASVGDENINHNLFFNGKLYFYLDDELLGTYTCVSCTVALTTIDDTDYHTKYYRYGDKIMNPVLSRQYAIFNETNTLTLYSILSNKTVTTYEAVKTYNVSEKNNILIYKQSGLWGLLNVSDITKNIDNKYDYIAYSGDYIDNYIDMSKLITKSGNTWRIIKSNDELIKESKYGEIVDFNDVYYVTYQDGAYHIYDYKDNEYLSDYVKKDINIINNYIFVLEQNTLHIYSSLNELPVKEITVSQSFKDIDYKYNDGKYELILDEKVTETIELGSNV